MRRPVAVTFLPSGATAWVDPGATLLEAARACSVTIVAPCGGRGICGSCGVRVIEGDLEPPDEYERRGLERAPQGVRLACRARVQGPTTVRPIVSSARPGAMAPASAGDVVVGVDLGTTNVAAIAVEGSGGREVGRAVVANRQQSWGSDVLSRVSASLGGEDAPLRDAAIASVIEAIHAATGDGCRVGRVVVAGNSVMAGLLAGVDLSASAVAPYPAPSVPASVTVSTPDRLQTPDEWLLVPPIASFVGGDVLAGAVHTGVLYAETPAMLVDLGTNAEVLLRADGRLWAASAPAGPAFEGAGTECGGPVAEGAIVSVRVEDGDVVTETIGGAAPAWFSGAGLISALSALRRVGHIDAEGRLSTEGPLRQHVRAGEDGVLRVQLAEGAACAQLSQLDVRSVQLAKAAVRVGVEAVLRAARITAADLADLYVAGAFGGAVCKEDLVDLGIVPSSAARAVRYIGNASLLGAAAMALDPDVLSDAVRRVAGVNHVELASDAEFAKRLMTALSLQAYDV